jgi:Fur family transcriptional regulator, ferric uptake regulator
MELSTDIGKLDTILKDGRHSKTPARMKVFEALWHGPQTAADLIAQLGEQIDRATIYRTLALFEALGVVNRFWQSDREHYELSEIFVPHHHHATCVNCGNITDLTIPSIESELLKQARSAGFLPVDHMIELTGYCANCNKS